VTAALVVALLLSLVGGQALADASVRSGGFADTGRVLGRTGFAYLTGLRTFAAAVLYARLDPINDGYYPGTTLPQKKFLIPSLYVIILLDPQFEQAYYVAPWILMDAGRTSEAARLAEAGVSDNPGSGLLHASLAQVLVSEGDVVGAVRQADIALALKWADEGERYDNLASMEAIYQRAKLRAKAHAAFLERLRLQPKYQAPPPGGAGQ
jgi:tetratricopeptide (TPR) repeat protein